MKEIIADTWDHIGRKKSCFFNKKPGLKTEFLLKKQIKEAKTVMGYMIKGNGRTKDAQLMAAQSQKVLKKGYWINCAHNACLPIIYET